MKGFSQRERLMLAGLFLSKFDREGLITVQSLVDAYNRIVSENETDPSLQISMA